MISLPRLFPPVHSPRPGGLGRCPLSSLPQPELTITDLFHIAAHRRPCVCEASLGFLASQSLPPWKNNTAGQEDTGLGSEPKSLRLALWDLSHRFGTSRCPPAALRLTRRMIAQADVVQRGMLAASNVLRQNPLRTVSTLAKTRRLAASTAGLARNKQEGVGLFLFPQARSF